MDSFITKSGGHFKKPLNQREFDFHVKYKTELCINWH